MRQWRHQKGGPFVARNYVLRQTERYTFPIDQSDRRYTEQFGHTTSTLALDLSHIACMTALCPLLMKQFCGTVLTTFLAHM